MNAGRLNAGAVDGERLHSLLGGADLANLRQRLRDRYERGAARDEFTVTALTDQERRALAGLLGRRSVAAESMRIRRSELDAVLSRAGIATSLRAALEFLDGPLADRPAERAARDQAWRSALAAAREPRLAALLAAAPGVSLLRRLASRDPERASVLLAQAARVLERLPGTGMSRAQLAAEVLGDSHGLDHGRAVATLVLRAGAATLPLEVIEAAGLKDVEEPLRERWAQLGITVNELALPALCLNLPADPAPGVTASRGEPHHLSLRLLLRRPPAWRVNGLAVFVCENPNIVAIAADRLGAGCAPLVCTDGMPAAAQQTPLAQLAAAGASLHYHGDFDWGGLTIGNFVMREFGARPWRFGTADYLAAIADHGMSLPDTKFVAARWDEGLAGAMSQRRTAVHEEGVVDSLLIDLAAKPPQADAVTD